MNPRPLFFIAICLGIYLAYMWGLANYEEKKRKFNEEHGLVEQPVGQLDDGRRDQREPARLQNAGDAAVAGRELRPGDTAKDPAKPEGLQRPAHPDGSGSFRSDQDGTLIYTANARGITSVEFSAYKSSKDQTKNFLLLPHLKDEVANLALRVDILSSGDKNSEEIVDRFPDLSRENWEFSHDDDGLRYTNRIDENGTAAESGLEIVREVRNVPGEYYLEYVVRLTNHGAERRETRYTIFAPVGMSFEATRWGGLQVVSGRVISNGPVAPTVEDVTSIDSRWDFSNRPCFVGLQDNYFLSLVAAVNEDLSPADTIGRVSAELIPDRLKMAEVVEGEFPGRGLEDLSPSERAMVEDEASKSARISLRTGDIEIEPGDTVEHRYICYLGPRDNTRYAQFSALDIEGTNSYGNFLTTALVNVFRFILGFFHSIFSSWGVAIICLTLVVRSCLHPLNRKQQIGMSRYQKKMTKIQPLIKEVQDTYSDDRMKMHQEMQKIFKEHDANPAKMMMGCLMIFLQLPIWIGLITTLYFALELRQAPFLWIGDLTKPDMTLPLGRTVFFLGDYLNVLPFLYMALMFVQIKMQPKAADPQAQQMQRMTTIMMMAFGIIFYDFPSGLMVYFITSTLYGLVESRLIKRIIAREDEAISAGGDGPGKEGDTGPAGALYSSSKGVQRKKPKKEKKVKF